MKHKEKKPYRNEQKKIPLCLRKSKVKLVR